MLIVTLLFTAIALMSFLLAIMSVAFGAWRAKALYTAVKDGMDDANETYEKVRILEKKDFERKNLWQTLKNLFSVWRFMRMVRDLFYSIRDIVLWLESMGGSLMLAGIGIVMSILAGICYLFT